MPGVTEVPIGAFDISRFREPLGARYDELQPAIEHARELMAGRVVWHVNSTAAGGGVAEMLATLLAYTRGAGVDVRWLVISGDSEFFEITKRIHNNLHGSEGDGGPLGETERRHYERVASENAAALTPLVRPQDIVYLHDPQPAGLTPLLRETGAHLVWRCHVGLDTPNECARRAWSFLLPYVEPADHYVFSREAFAWEGLDRSRTWTVHPSIDPFSPKNQELEPAAVEAILGRTGIVEDGGSVASFRRQDGSPGRVDRPAEMIQDAPLRPDDELVTKVSRWDRLKDPVGVMQGFAEHCADREAHLLLAGPATGGVADDPEAADVLTAVTELRKELGPDVRHRVHLACLPMDDLEENAATVNAIQRHATVVVQKSLAEGFGLTVAEAMWKERAVVSTRVGGIQEQIDHGTSGLLIDDASDLRSFGRAVSSLLGDRTTRERMGRAARERVRDQFLVTRHLLQYADLLSGVLGDRQSEDASAPASTADEGPSRTS
ncbi:MAG: glycosyltransferase [Solirubrobacterales bacterium]